jgi:hypothetical protein
MGSYHWPAPRRRCEGRPGLRPWAIAKASLRMLGQSLARGVYPKGIHGCHVIVDGEIDTLKLRARDANWATETIISPVSIADMVLFYAQTNARRLDARTRPASSPGVVVNSSRSPFRSVIDLACTLA